MARLFLSLFGPLRTTLDEQPVSGFESAKVRALLVYLAANAARPHSRSALAGLLWPEQPEDVARNNLRQALANMRRALGDQLARPPFLLIKRDSVQFNPSGDYWLDVAVFAEHVAACATHAHRQLETCLPCMRRLRAAVGLYQGDFLAQFTVSASAAFEEWALLQREHFHRLAMEALAHLTAYHERRGEYETARGFAARQIELEPWCEDAHRRLIRLLAIDGQRAEALAQYERCRAVLAAELGVEPEVETEALAAQVRLGGAAHSAARAPAVALPRLARSPNHNLPPQLTSFVGREDELVGLAELLATPACRIITVVGPGGIGKTRLAIEAAAEHVPMFAHGAWFVALAGAADAADLARAVVAALKLAAAGDGDLEGQLLAYLREKELLLVLDNVEPLLAGADRGAGAIDLLLRILRGAPGVTLMVTSRERLALGGEWLYDVGGLRCPPEHEVADIEAFSAVQLFVQRARQVQGSFSLAASQAHAVARLCHLVEGLPLGIELAAAAVRERSCGEIAQAIATNIASLATPLRDVPARHRSLWAALDYSWRMLSREQRRALRRLAVFRGGIDAEAAAAVLGAPGSEPPLAVLGALLDKSLLRRNAAGRYDMHELLRQYAGQKLRAARELDLVCGAHADYIVLLVEAIEQRLTGHDQASWFERLATEYENIRAALDWSLDKLRVEQAARIAGSLWRFWLARGYLVEGRAWLARVLAVDGELSPAALAKALRGAGTLAWGQGDYTEAIGLCERSLGLARTLGDRDGEATCLHYLGSLALHQSDYVRATALLQASLALRRALGDSWGKAICLANLGAAAGRQGDVAEAERCYTESLALLRPLGDNERIAVVLDNLGAVARDRGDHARARRLYEEGLGLFRELGNKWNIATCLNNLGGIALDQADYAEARERYAESLLLLQELGDKDAIAGCLEGLAGVAGGCGLAEQAARLYGAAEAIRAAIGSPLSPVARERYERAVAVARAQLPPLAFAAAWQAGRAMTLDGALAEARALGEAGFIQR
jgi:predicted ATPase/DNA-binding SARP family transcriptional activator